MKSWTREAGFVYGAGIPGAVSHRSGERPETFKGRKVLHRSDTGGALAVVSDSYHVVQPAEVMGFFEKLVQLGGLRT